MWLLLSNLFFKFIVGHAPLDSIVGTFSKVEDQLTKLVDVKTNTIAKNNEAIANLNARNDDHQNEIDTATTILGNVKAFLGKL